MSQVLYQKYRPQKFAEVFGQQHIKVVIQNQIASGKTAHAYLFCGPRAVGKTTIARILAKALNCENRKEGEFEPCDECLTCKEIKQGNALDIMEIDAASHTGVDNVRENIIANARITPSKSKYKVFIIDEVHMLSPSAFNALLKTLEEPPKNVVFVLATTEIHKVPGTIISRCQRYDFKKIGTKDIIENLNYVISEEGILVDAEVLRNIAIQSEGCLRDAQSLLGQVLFLDDKRITAESAEIIIPRANFSILADFSEFALNGNIEKAIYFINNLVQEGVDLKIFSKNLVEFLRKTLLVKIGGGLDYFSMEFDDETERRILKISENLDVGKIMRAIGLFLEAGENLKKSEIISLPLEMAVLKFAGEGGIKNVEVKERGIENLELRIKNENEDIGVKKAIVEEKENWEFRNSGNGEKVEDEEDEKTKKKKLEVNDHNECINNKQCSPSHNQSAQEEINNDKAMEDKNQEIETQDGKSSLRIEEIQNRWEEVIEGVKKNNHSMCFILKISKPIEVCGNILKLAHSHKFHQDRIQDLKNKHSLEAVLKEIFKYELLVESVINSEATSEFNEDNNVSTTRGADGEKIIEKEVDKEVINTGNSEQDNILLDDILSEMGGEVVG